VTVGTFFWYLKTVLYALAGCTSTKNDSDAHSIRAKKSGVNRNVSVQVDF